MLKYFDVEGVTTETIEEIHNAISQFLPLAGQVDAYESLMTDPEYKLIMNKVREGQYVSNEEVKKSLVWFLNSYRCHFPHKCISALISRLKEVTTIIRENLRGVPLELLGKDHSSIIYSVFQMLCEVPHVSATTASKVLSVIQPKTFIMWDGQIAGAYGFAGNAEGYCRFSLLMRDFIRRLRQFEPPSLESRLAVRQRSWQVPLTKLLDEWNWVTMKRLTM